MRALLQRVRAGSVTINDNEKHQIGPGLVILLGITHTDTPADADALAAKCASLRIFEDSDGKMNLSLSDTSRTALVVSQFTLYADTRKGRRPAFTDAARPELANPLYEQFLTALRHLDIYVESGEFGADMLVEIQNDGPVTILLEIPYVLEKTPNISEKVFF